MLTDFIDYLMRTGYNSVADGAAASREKKKQKSKNDQASGWPERELIIGETIPGLRDRGRGPQPVRFPLERRFRHLFVTGRSGSGKSILALNISQWDLENGVGLVISDFRGESTDIFQREIRSRFPIEDVVNRCLFIDLRASSIFSTKGEPVLGFNILTSLNPDPYIAVAIFLDILRAMWGDGVLGVRLSDQLKHSFLALAMSLSGPYALTDLEPFLLEPSFRASVLAGITDPIVVNFFKRFDSGKDRESEADSVLNKLSPLLSTHQKLRAMLSVREPKFSFSEFLRTTKSPLILICADASSAGRHLAGIVSSLFLTAITRAAMPSDKEPGTALKSPLHILLDEFINFASACREPLDELIREGRKFNVFSTLITQSPGLLDSYTKSLVVNVVGNIAYFGQGPEDANTVASMIASESLPKAILRSQLSTAKPGVAFFFQEGCSLQRIRGTMPPRATATDDEVRALRAAVLARWGTSPEVIAAPSPLPAAPLQAPGAVEVREVEESAAAPTPRRKKKP